MDQVKGKVFVVTGASSGIGLALVEELLKHGALVSFCARSLDKLETIQNRVDPEKKNTFINVCDVTKKEDCQKLMQTTIDHFGRIDSLINNAGISMRALFSDLDLDVLEQVMNTNFWGSVYCTKYAIEDITKNKGNVLAISSIAGYRGLPGRTGYSASKFALQGFMEALRTEHFKTGVNVMVVCPGFTSSNIRKKALVHDGSEQGKTPRKEEKMMSAEEVAQKTIRAVQQRRRSLVLTTQGKLTVFLNKFAPKFMDKMVFKTMAKEDNSPFK